MASSDTNIYKVKLASDLAKSLQFVSVGGYDVAYIDSIIEIPQDADSVQQPPGQHVSNNLSLTSILLPLLLAFPEVEYSWCNRL